MSKQIFRSKTDLPKSILGKNKVLFKTFFAQNQIFMPNQFWIKNKKN